MRQKIYRLLVQNSSFTKVIFLLYYSHIIRGAITTLMLKDGWKNSINNFKGDPSLIGTGNEVISSSAGADTVSDAQAARAVITNLGQDFAFISAGQGFAFIPIHDTPSSDRPLRIMPLGDSLTSGVAGTNDKDSGGYRTELWNKLVADGLRVNFVGSQSSGPASLGNKDHEGHDGWTINQIASSVNGWLNTFQPDLVLLMIGTNDTRKHSIRTMISELSALIDQITAHPPHVQLLVASIPPIYPVKQSARRVLRAIYFNSAIPLIVDSKVAQGKKVHFVDMRSLTVDDLTSSISLALDKGLHLNAQGYRKIANLWHDAVLRAISNRQSTSASW